MSKLEKYILDHRHDFDDLRAPRGLFQKIVPEERKVHSIWKWVAVAATALLILSVGYNLGMQNKPESRIAGWNEFQEAEQYYQNKINVKMEEIKMLPVGDEVMTDIQALDEVYQQLRQQLLDDPNINAKILLSAMIKHQKQKLQVMDEILQRVEKYKNNTQTHIDNEKRIEM